MRGLEVSEDSAGQVGLGRKVTRRQQGALRFGAHLALSMAAMGLLPPPHDMAASITLREMQASAMNSTFVESIGAQNARMPLVFTNAMLQSCALCISYMWAG